MWRRKGKASFELGARSDQVFGSFRIFPVGATALEVVGPLQRLSGAEVGTGWGWDLDGNHRNQTLDYPQKRGGKTESLVWG